MDTELYCTTLEDLEKVQAIQAIHQAYMQLKALTDHWDCGYYDNAPALDALRICLENAGHIGFAP